MFYFMNIVRSFMNYAIFRELCDQMRFEADCAKLHHRVIPEGQSCRFYSIKVVERILKKCCLLIKYSCNRKLGPNL